MHRAFSSNTNNMESATIGRKWKQLLLFAFLSTLTHGQSHSSCLPADFSFDQLDKQLQNIKNCLETVSDNWTSYQHGNILNQLQALTDIIQRQDNKAFQKLLPENCPAPAVPENGGLLCLSVKDKIYCKPMCNAGYDFNFLRRSRLFEECSTATKHTWTTQYIGGNRLAICNKSHIEVSGAPSAYFPKGEDCHITKSNEQLTQNITNIFKSELAKVETTESESTKLLCGNINN